MGTFTRGNLWKARESWWVLQNDEEFTDRHRQELPRIIEEGKKYGEPTLSAEWRERRADTAYHADDRPRIDRGMGAKLYADHGYRGNRAARSRGALLIDFGSLGL